MTAEQIERFRRLEALFDAALERPAAVRDAWLSGQCAGDRGLLEEVRQLLRDHEQLSANAPPPEPLPRFGPWQAIRLLGRGGMGVVYLAERADGAFQMTTAVKVVPLALASPDIEERFRRERQFLASLDHPRIARLIDGGVSSNSLPFLVMEYVDGVAIDQYCDAQRLNVRERIGIMRQVLDALAYVHSRQVIHRDLKASNIVVDAGGNAKLLDFGTARLVDAGGDNSITRTGVFAFTPEYASPEQAEGRTPAIASDIYSAGVLLYRLLTGRPPYQLDQSSAASVSRSIRDTPPDPSGLERPLDAILAKALRKDPLERYLSVAELDADLARYLAGSAVQARRSRKMSWMAAAAGAMVAAVAVLAWQGALRESPSLAVLPFANAGINAADQYFSDGLTGELTDALGRVKGLRVIAGSSAAQFHDRTMDLREVGRRLGANYLLEGSIERSGDRIRIIARLERAADATQTWSQIYERPAADLFAVEADLAGQIARQLKAAGVPRAKHVPNQEAYRAVLEGQYLQRQMTPAALAQAEASFRHAIDVDPAYALAYTALGITEYNRSASRASIQQTDAERRTAEHLLRKAAEMDPELSAPHITLAILVMQYNWDWEAAERELRLAERSGITAAAESQYAILRAYHGNFTEADQHIRRALQLDPLGTVTLNNVGLVLYWEGRYAEAREVYQKLEKVAPNMIGPELLIDLTYIQEGHPELALPRILQLKARFPPAVAIEAMAAARAGRRDDALRLIRPFEEKYPNPGVAIQWLALVYAFMGDEANTIHWLERSADAHEFQAMNLAVHPAYASIRQAPAFRALMKRMRLDR
jgi:TolB-like protein/Tfp pilus assembly protein PilF